MNEKTVEFRKRLAELSREQLLEIIKDQELDLWKGIQRVEWVFANKLRHLNWTDGSPITKREFTNEELALLVDEPFTPNPELTKMGISLEKQQQIHISSDTVLWAKHFLNVRPRVYQALILRDPSLRKVLRAGRRSGKSFLMAIKILHYAYTHNSGRVLVLAPMKSQVKLLFDEVLHICMKTPVEESLVRHVASPQYEIVLSNNSTVRFFTTGMKSGSKADIVRGQEAHLIILDEMDYMAPDDLDAVYVMLQKTAENQDEKELMAASTPTGKREKFWEWANNSTRFKEFWFPSYCFVPGTMITMGDGSLKPIQDIECGDFVLTEKGPQKVTRLFERAYDGDIINLIPYGDNQGIKVTPEHPISAALRVRRQKSFDWDWVKAGDLCEPTRRNLSSGFWLRNIFDVVEKTVSYDMTEFSPYFHECRPGRVSIERKFATGRSFINDFPKQIDTENESLATLLGWYIAEGSVEGFNEHYGLNTVVSWSLHESEKFAIEEITNALDKLGAGKPNITYRTDSHSITLRINNAPLAILLSHLAGTGSLTKSLSNDVMRAPVAFQKVMFNAWAMGDGWQRTIANYDIRTSSAILAKQMRIIGLRFGECIPSLTRSHNQKSRQISMKYKEYSVAPTYLLSYEPNVRSFLGKDFTSKGEFRSLLKRTIREHYVGNVYNFEVENTNSYVAENILVHNCSPFFDKTVEDEFREIYTAMAYRHEIEADWGEDAEGVYPRKNVDLAFSSARFLNKEESPDVIRRKSDWGYAPRPTNSSSFYSIGVDWDKFGAGTNIAVLEYCFEDHEDERFRNKVRCIYREEIPKSEFTLTNAVNRIIDLNSIFQPQFIYVDRGYGEQQVELLKKYGIEHPQSGLRERVKGISFSETINIIDPQTKGPVTKDLKPFMVDTLRRYMEQERIVFPSSDEELYNQLISYVVVRTSVAGRPVFEASGKFGDHAHDAIVLALLAIEMNYGEFSAYPVARRSTSVSSSIFIGVPTVDEDGNDSPYALLRRNKLTTAKIDNKIVVKRTVKRKMF